MSLAENLTCIFNEDEFYFGKLFDFGIPEAIPMYARNIIIT